MQPTINSSEVTPTPHCRVCGFPKTRHQELEATGKIHHVYNDRDARIIPLKKDDSPPDMPVRQPNKVTLTPTALTSDPVLRMILVEKGIVNPEELTQMEQRFWATGMVVSTMPPAEVTDAPPPAS